MHSEDIRWDLYPQVASIPQARAFVVRLQQFSRRPKTIDAYARHLDRYLASFADAPVARWVEADEGSLLAYLNELRSGRTRRAAPQRSPPPANVVYLSGSRMASTTITQHVVALRQFYDYLIRAALRADRTNPLPRGCTGRGGDAPRRGPVRAPTHLPWIAPPAIWEHLVPHIVLHETARNRALLLVTCDGALRREEVVGLRADDYDRHRALLLVRAETSKSGRDRWVPLTPFSQRALDHYLDRHRRVLVDAYGLAEPGPLFLSESTRNPGRALVPGAVNDVVEVLRAALDLPQVRPHTLRHQRLSALKAAGVPLEDIALFAGHASTETTRLYLHLTPIELGEKIRAATHATDSHLQRLIREALDGR
jgi:site-specific recombinase XerD